MPLHPITQATHAQHVPASVLGASTTLPINGVVSSNQQPNTPNPHVMEQEFSQASRWSSIAQAYQRAGTDTSPLAMPSTQSVPNAPFTQPRQRGASGSGLPARPQAAQGLVRRRVPRDTEKNKDCEKSDKKLNVYTHEDSGKKKCIKLEKGDFKDDENTQNLVTNNCKRITENLPEINKTDTLSADRRELINAIARRYMARLGTSTPENRFKLADDLEQYFNASNFTDFWNGTDSKFPFNTLFCTNSERDGRGGNDPNDCSDNDRRSFIGFIEDKLAFYKITQQSDGDVFLLGLGAGGGLVLFVYLMAFMGLCFVTSCKKEELDVGESRTAYQERTRARQEIAEREAAETLLGTNAQLHLSFALDNFIDINPNPRRQGYYVEGLEAVEEEFGPESEWPEEGAGNTQSPVAGAELSDPDAAAQARRNYLLYQHFPPQFTQRDEGVETIAGVQAKIDNFERRSQDCTAHLLTLNNEGTEQGGLTLAKKREVRILECDIATIARLKEDCLTTLSLLRVKELQELEAHAQEQAVAHAVQQELAHSRGQVYRPKEGRIIPPVAAADIQTASESLYKLGVLVKARDARGAVNKLTLELEELVASAQEDEEEALKLMQELEQERKVEAEAKKENKNKKEKRADKKNKAGKDKGLNPIDEPPLPQTPVDIRWLTPAINAAVTARYSSGASALEIQCQEQIAQLLTQRLGARMNPTDSPQGSGFSEPQDPPLKEDEIVPLLSEQTTSPRLLAEPSAIGDARRLQEDFQPLFQKEAAESSDEAQCSEDPELLKKAEEQTRQFVSTALNDFSAALTEALPGAIHDSLVRESYERARENKGFSQEMTQAITDLLYFANHHPEEPSGVDGAAECLVLGLTHLMNDAWKDQIIPEINSAVRNLLQDEPDLKSLMVGGASKGRRMRIYRSLGRAMGGILAERAAEGVDNASVSGLVSVLADTLSTKLFLAEKAIKFDSPDQEQEKSRSVKSLQRELRLKEEKLRSAAKREVQSVVALDKLKLKYTQKASERDQVEIVSEAKEILPEVVEVPPEGAEMQLEGAEMLPGELEMLLEGAEILPSDLEMQLDKELIFPEPEPEPELKASISMPLLLSDSYSQLAARVSVRTMVPRFSEGPKEVFMVEEEVKPDVPSLSFIPSPTPSRRSAQSLAPSYYIEMEGMDTTDDNTETGQRAPLTVSIDIDETTPPAVAIDIDQGVTPDDKEAWGWGHVDAPLLVGAQNPKREKKKGERRSFFKTHKK